MFHRKFDTKYKLFNYFHLNGGSTPPPYDLIDKRELAILTAHAKNAAVRVDSGVGVTMDYSRVEKCLMVRTI